VNPDLHDLIERQLSGTLTDEEASLLQSALASDEESRRLYLDYMNLDAALASQAASQAAARELIAASAAPASRRWFQRWPIAAAVGVLAGLSAASLVYGIVAQRQVNSEPRVTAQTLLTEGFEDESMPRDRSFPRRADVWSGDLQAPQGAVAGVVPAEGQRMVLLPPVEKRRFSYASRFLDASALPPAGQGQSRQVEVTARFHGGPAGDDDRFQIRLAAFAEDIPGARAIWLGGHLDERALVHVAKTVKPSPDAQGWTTLRSAIDLPAGARYLLISLAAGVADDEAPKTEHYLDDVQVRLITRDGPRQAPSSK
jgi:hypothetical protein